MMPLRDSEADESRPPRSRRRRGLRFAAAGLAAAALGLGLWLAWVVELAAGTGAKVDITVPAGGSIDAAAPLLQRRGVIPSAALFRVWLHLSSPPPIQAGQYVLRRHESFSAVISSFEHGPAVVRITIPPGFTLAQIAQRVAATMPGHSAARFVAEANSGRIRSPLSPPGGTSLEGLLYPATYSFAPNATDSQIISAMVDRFAAQARAIHLAAGAAAVGLSPYQVIVVASMVEREAKVASDRPKVARVIYNRLARNMALQIDATEAYALGNPPGGVTPAQLRLPSPYNTYLHKGLPPTPIASPGLASLEAALSPAPGPWLYYVVVSASGREAFSATYAGQQANVALARQKGLR